VESFNQKKGKLFNAKKTKQNQNHLCEINTAVVCVTYSDCSVVISVDFWC